MTIKLSRHKGNRRKSCANTHHHAEIVALLLAGLLDAVFEHEVHELIKATQHARHTSIAIQLDCGGRS
jgi:hypothetical protein